MNFQSNKVLKKLVELLKERNFLTRRKLLRSDNTEFISYKYGPPGASLRNNFITKWREEVQFSPKNNEPCFFVENSTLPIMADNYNSTNSTSFSQEEGGLCSPEYISHSLRMCASTLRETNVKIPFTIAQIGVRCSQPSDTNSNEKLFLFDSNEQTDLTLLYFCSPDPDTTHKTFQTLLQQRLLWWQQFANFPTNCQLLQTNNIQNTNTNKLCLSSSSGVQYQFPWGWNTIEKTFILDSDTITHSLKDLPISTSGTDLNGDVLKASVVVSNVTLEKGLLALLFDSYQERTRKKLPKSVKTNTTKQPRVVSPATRDSTKNTTTGVLKLHASLSPYKVGVAIYGNKTGQLRQLALRVIKDLKTLDLQILGSAEVALSLESQCISYEQIGVLYMVLINDKSLETGLTRIKNNKNDDDKKENEQVHVSDIKQYILQHLKLATSQ